MIGQLHLLPKQLREHGLTSDIMHVPPESIATVSKCFMEPKIEPKSLQYMSIFFYIMMYCYFSGCGIFLFPYIYLLTLFKHHLLDFASRHFIMIFNSSVGEYTREAGVRTLERKIGALCRAVAVQVAEAKPEDQGIYEYL